MYYVMQPNSTGTEAPALRPFQTLPDIALHLYPLYFIMLNWCFYVNNPLSSVSCSSKPEGRVLGTSNL